MKQIFELLATTVFCLTLTNCTKYLQDGKIDNNLTNGDVFSNDESANAVAVNVFSDIMKASDFLNGYMSRYMGLYADEIINTGETPLDSDAPYITCNVTPADKVVLSCWNKGFIYIYQCNNIIENVKDNKALSDSARKRLLGEAFLLRAFNYFYLINLFGDVPEIIETDFRKNDTKPRENKELIWTIIIRDLLEAERLLPQETGSNPGLLAHIRPTAWTAKTLLARVYLFDKNWEKAEQYATSVIESGKFMLESDLNAVFQPNSKEVILQFETVKNGVTSEALFFLPVGNKEPLLVLRQELLNSFEMNDKRKKQWVGSSIVGNKNYFYPNKYKLRTATTSKEYNVVLRLSEVYLIRAEARTRLGKLYGDESAAADLNKIRQRAGITTIPNQPSQQQMRYRVEQERRVELFTEWGHRWFDLKRTEGFNTPAFCRAEEVLSVLKPGFKTFRLLLPVPETERMKNSALDQNDQY